MGGGVVFWGFGRSGLVPFLFLGFRGCGVGFLFGVGGRGGGVWEFRV